MKGCPGYGRDNNGSGQAERAPAKPVLYRGFFEEDTLVSTYLRAREERNEEKKERGVSLMN